MSRPCKCGDERGHAKAVESAIFQCLLNAGLRPESEDHWRNKADVLERKFTTEHGRHYSYALGAA